jgi:hypothetical protein
MDLRHHGCHAVEGGLVPRPPWAHNGMADTQVGQLAQVREDGARACVRPDESGHGLFDGAIVAASVFAMGTEDFQVVPQVVSETGPGQVEQVGHVAIAGDKAQGLTLLLPAIKTGGCGCCRVLGELIGWSSW